MVTDAEEAHVGAVCAEHLDRGAADEAPAAGSCERVYGCLAVGDADAANGSASSGDGEPGSGQGFGQFAEVGKARNEAEEIDGVGC